LGGEGVEPSTSSLSEKRSTAELATHNPINLITKNFNGLNLFYFNNKNKDVNNYKIKN
jgi:hypothetical protein